ANDPGKILENFAEITAGRSLDRDRRDEQRQVIGSDSEIKIAHRRFEVGAVGDFVGDDTEFRADRIGQFARHHGNGDRHRMAGAERAHDDVDGVGKLRAEFFLPASAQEAQHKKWQHRAAGRGHQDSMQDRAIEYHGPDESGHSADSNKKKQPPESKRQARLQHELIEIDQRQSVLAAAGEPALSPQLHENAFTVGLVVHHTEAAIDVLTVRRPGVKQQVAALNEQRDRDADENVDQVNGIEVEYRHQSGCVGSKKAPGILIP